MRTPVFTLTNRTVAYSSLFNHARLVLLGFRFALKVLTVHPLRCFHVLSD